MGTSYVEVKYLNSDGTQSARAYTYFSNLDLKLKQKVYAPTARNPKQEAMVVAVNCPEPPFPCKEITEIMPEEAEE